MKGGVIKMKKKRKTRRYAVTYLPRKKSFAVVHLKKGFEIKSRYKKNTTIIRSTSPNAALRKLSKRSYRGETGKILK